MRYMAIGLAILFALTFWVYPLIHPDQSTWQEWRQLVNPAASAGGGENAGGSGGDASSIFQTNSYSAIQDALTYPVEKVFSVFGNMADWMSRIAEWIT